MLDETIQPDPGSLITRARRGNEQALGELLESYRPYLALLARMKSDRRLQAKLTDSDLVQETYFSAHRDFAQFKGNTEPEFTAWLRQIMIHAAANFGRDFRAKRRDVRLEQQLADQFNQSSHLLERAIVDPGPTPSQAAARRERAVLLANAIDQLPKDYRDVLVMRELQGKSLAEIAASMDRTVNATQKLWARAVVKVRFLLTRNEAESEN